MRRLPQPHRRGLAPALAALAMLATLPVAALWCRPARAAGGDTPDTGAPDVGTPEAQVLDAWAVDARGRSLRVAFDPGNRWYVGGGWGAGVAAGGDTLAASAGHLETALRLRHRFDFPEEDVAWKLYHRLLAARVWLNDGSGGSVPVIDAALFRGTYMRWERGGWLTIPSSPPRRLRFPLNIGVEVRAGEFRTHARDTGAAADIGVAAGAVLLDVWRSQELGSYAQFGFGPSYGLRLHGRFEDGGGDTLEHMVSPGSEATFTLHHESADGRHLVDASVGGGWLWASDSGWNARAHARAEWEWIWLAVNDQPVSLFTEVAWSWDGMLADAQHDLRASAGLRLGFTLD